MSPTETAAKSTVEWWLAMGARTGDRLYSLAEHYAGAYNLPTVSVYSRAVELAPSWLRAQATVLS